jgi:hypothetical protein
VTPIPTRFGIDYYAPDHGHDNVEESACGLTLTSLRGAVRAETPSSIRAVLVNANI